MKRLLISYLTFCFLIAAGCSPEIAPVPEPPGKVIVLMYHRIVTGEASNLYERSIDKLEADLKYLKENNI
ncbi:MAG TPA: hypothetical protein DEO60_03570, partial [Bacteroidales bacterium]|nr:hypothetical protein [Bacteroidales bacterium]